MFREVSSSIQLQSLESLDNGLTKNEKLNDNSSSISTIESFSETLPKTQLFYQFRHGQQFPVSLALTEQNLIINDNSDHVFQLSDVLGANIKPVNIKHKYLHGTILHQQFLTYKLKIFFLIKTSNKSFMKEETYRREYKKVKLYIQDANKASKWRNLILHAANNPDFLTLSKIYGLDDLPPFKRDLLVFINPNSGHHRAEKVWDQAKKLLKKAGCEFKEILTQTQGYAKNLIRNYDANELKKVDGFVAVSGDGIMHEIINGLFQRPDWRDFNHIPFGIIPCGTSNALIQNLLYKTKEEVSLESACYLIAKGDTTKSDLTMLETEDGSQIFSFLLFAWATMAEVDVTSNDLRPLGKVRFTITGIWNLLLLKKYHAKISYTTENKDLPNINKDIVDEGWKTFDDRFGHFSLHNVPWIGTKHQAVPVADFQDGVNHLLAYKGSKISRRKLAKTLAKLKGRLFEGDRPNPSLGLEYEKIKAFRMKPYGEELGYYAIDGEAYNATKIQGKVLEKVLTFFSN